MSINLILPSEINTPYGVPAKTTPRQSENPELTAATCTESKKRKKETMTWITSVAENAVEKKQQGNYRKSQRSSQNNN